VHLCFSTGIEVSSISFLDSNLKREHIPYLWLLEIRRDEKRKAVNLLKERKFVLESRHLKILLFSTVVLVASIFGTMIIFRPRSVEPTINENHFSVRWMGFAPTDYDSSYPEYYICVNNLKEDPLPIQIALQVKNQEDSGYFFKVDQYEAPPSGWSILPMDVGYIEVDQTKKFIYDKASRSKPASIPEGRLTESINLMVQAYYDSEYTNLYSQDNFLATFNLIDRTSDAWTQLDYNNFDDKTTQGWSAQGGGSYSPDVYADSTYYRSFQYSLLLHQGATNIGWCGYRGLYRIHPAGFQRSLDVSTSYQEAYLIYSIRSSGWIYSGVGLDGVTHFRFDVEPNENTWYQFTIPIPIGTESQVTIWAVNGEDDKCGSSDPSYWAWLDDVYLIAKP